MMLGTLGLSMGIAPLLAAAVIAVVLCVMTAVMVREKRAKFADRKDYDLHQLWERFFAESGLPKEVAVRVLTEVSLATDIPCSKLQPDDRFAVELAPTPGWEFDDGIWLLPESMHRIFGGDISVYSLETNPTVAELMRTVSRMLKPSHFDL
jgi:hypothetical protein